MKKQFHTILLICVTLVAVKVKAQSPKPPSAINIYEAIQKLNVLGSVLYIAAHPDDENTRLISYLSNSVKARTGYLSLTRGDGGQNLIGPELRELLGVIRTQELLAARRVDGGEQLFSRANDFGYSKHPDETLEIWNKDDVLHDIILAIRTFKPDIIINRFDHRTPGTTHGHHTASALLSVEAFDKANTATIYPKMLDSISTWQPKRLFFNTGWWFYGSKANFEKADKSQMLKVDIGTYYPLKGLSNNEIAALASSQHLCQGFGRLAQRGSQQEYIEFLKGMPLDDTKDIFSGIDTSWERIKGGKAIGAILNAIEDHFNFKAPATHIPDLLKAYKLLQRIEDPFWKKQKTKALKHIIAQCAGLYLEASSNTNWAAPGATVPLKIEVLNRSITPIHLVNFTVNNTDISKNILLNNNTKFAFEETLSIPLKAKPTTPYWLNKKSSLGMYNVDDASLIGKPETPRTYTIDFNLLINDTPITFTKPIVQRFAQPDKGELYRPFEIIPDASVQLKEKVFIFESEQPRKITVTVSAGKSNLEGTIELNHSKDWQVYPKQQKISITQKGARQDFLFTVVPPKTQNESTLQPIVKIKNKLFTKTLIPIDYEHIPYQTVLLPSESKVVRLDIEKRGTTIGYIEGAGDVVPQSLRQIGYKVELLKPKAITAETLRKFDAIVVGIRAYNILEDLNYKQQILFDYVANGGNMVVQYNTSHRLKTKTLAPYPLELSRNRVTDENATVTFLEPQHEVLHTPNTITTQDFEGWTQERGLYFPSKWDKAFTPILAMNDKNETSKEGSLLIAKHGKGYYIYTGLSFFREFPAGVAGAYRLFANILSLGKTNAPPLESDSKN